MQPLTITRALDLITAWAENAERNARTMPNGLECDKQRNLAANYRAVLGPLAKVPELIRLLQANHTALDDIGDICLFEDGVPQTALGEREVDEVFHLSTSLLAETETLLLEVTK